MQRFDFKGECLLFDDTELYVLIHIHNTYLSFIYFFPTSPSWRERKKRKGKIDKSNRYSSVSSFNLKKSIISFLNQSS